MCFSIVWGLFQLLLNTRTVPNLRKVSTAAPIPKKLGVKQLTDFRPIVLTSILGKCTEKEIMRHLINTVSNDLDPLRCAYKKSKGADDGVLTISC